MIFAVLIKEWGGGHQVKKNGREEPLSPPALKTQIVSSEERMFQILDEEHTLTKDKNGIGREEASLDSHLEATQTLISSERGLKKDNMEHTLRDVETYKKSNKEVKRSQQSKKSGKPVANKRQKIKHRKQEIRKNLEKARKIHKIEGKGRRKNSKTNLEKENLQLKLEIAKVKKQREKLKKKIKRAKQRKKKEKHGTDINANFGRVSSRATECSEQWAIFTSVGLGLAPTVIKQVENCFYISTIQLQVNSILASDRTLIRKRSKKDDFLEHQSILQKALSGDPCNGSNAYGNPPPFKPNAVYIQIYLRP